MPTLEKIIQIDEEHNELSFLLERLGNEYHTEHPDAYESRINGLNEDILQP